MDIQDFVTSMQGLIAAIAGLAVGMVALIRETTRLLRWVIKRKVAKNKAKPVVPASFNVSRASILLIALSILVSGSILGYRQEVLARMPLDVRLTKQAWDAYNKNEYESAIRYAEECISEFKGQADREQHKLEQENAPLPPTGRVPDQEKEAIWRRGPLNVAGTCFYIKGRSLEALGQKQESIPALREASRYTYARCWDPKTKIFWNPAEAAGDRLQLLEK